MSTLFSQPTPVIVQIRRELRGKLPDEWLEEVVSILEYQLTYQTVEELPTNDLLKLSLGASFSVTLKAAETLPETPLLLLVPYCHALQRASVRVLGDSPLAPDSVLKQSALSDDS